MSNAQKQVDEPGKERVVPHMIQGPWSDIAVYGWHLVSEKFLQVIGQLIEIDSLTKRDPGVRSIVFRDDNRPEDCMARVAPDGGVISVNLMQVFSEALNDTVNNPSNAIWSNYWCHMILNILHELEHHDRVDHHGWWENEAQQREYENIAEDFAYDTLLDVAAAGMDIEPPRHTEDAFFMSQLRELFGSTDGDLLEDQKFMLDNNLMLYLPPTSKDPEVAFRRFRDVCMIMDEVQDPSGTRWDDGGFKQATAPLDMKPEKVEVKGTIRRPAEKAAPIEIADDEAYDEAIEVVPDMAYEEAYSCEQFADEPMQPDEESDMPMDYHPDLDDEPVSSQQQAAPIVAWVDQKAAEARAREAAARTAVQNAAANYQTQQHQQPTPEPARGAEPTVLPRTGLTSEQTMNIAFGVFNKIFDRMFSPAPAGGCGPQSGQELLNSGKAFLCGKNAIDIPIELTPEEQTVVVGYKGFDDRGWWQPQHNTSATGKIRGMVTKDLELPMYELILNVDGRRIVRRLLPQNPFKPGRFDGFSKPALQARGGARIMHVIDAEKTGMDAYGWKRRDNAWLPPDARF
jgi:hypothetical protein